MRTIHSAFIPTVLILLAFDFLSLSHAQVSSDNTLPIPTVVSSQDGQNYKVTKGVIVDDRNLFHSFKDFSIPAGGSVIFQNSNVENIFARITGNSRSNIDGLIQTNSNLFLINPKGFTFGSRAQLDIGGSFIVSTANRIAFEDGHSFSTNISESSILTMSTPIGLQLGADATSIDVLGASFLPMLEGQPDTTFAFVGSDITFTRSSLNVPSGRIELGSVSPLSFVGLDAALEGFTLNFDNVQHFQDINFLQDTLLDTSDRDGFKSAGPIRVYGKNIRFSENSSVLVANFTPDSRGAAIEINASESLLIDNSSFINSIDGFGSQIIINTKQLLLRDFSGIDASVVFGFGDGSIIINASESVELTRGAFISNFTFQTDIGGINISTKRLALTEGASIVSTTAGGATGDAGDITIEASDTIKISGHLESPFTDSVIFSTIFTGTVDENTSGNGGNINLKTPVLTVSDGGIISVSPDRDSQGQSGSINIQAFEKVLVRGDGTTLIAASAGSSSAGNVSIETSNLTIQDGAQVSVSSAGDGAAGSLLVNANIIKLEDKAALIANTNSIKGDGDIDLQADAIFLRDGSTITTNAFGTATGGDIIINSGIIFALNNSDITTIAEQSSGGRVEVISQGIFGLTERTLKDFDDPSEADTTILTTSDVAAFSQLGGPTLSGSVIFRTPETDPSDALLDLPVSVIDPTQLVTQGCSLNRGLCRHTANFSHRIAVSFT